MNEERSTKVKSLGKALNLLSCFTTRHPAWGISELSEHLEIAKSNVHNIVSTFCDMGYLIRTPPDTGWTIHSGIENAGVCFRD